MAVVEYLKNKRWALTIAAELPPDEQAISPKVKIPKVQRMAAAHWTTGETHEDTPQGDE